MTLGIIITDNKVHLYWFDVHYVRNCFVHTQKIYIAALTSGSNKSRINTDVYFLIHSSYMPENKWQKCKGWDVNDFFRLKWNKIKLVEAILDLLAANQHSQSGQNIKDRTGLAVLKVSKSRKQFMVSSILSKKERKQFDLRYHSSWIFSFAFWENSGDHKLLSRFTDL